MDNYKEYINKLKENQSIPDYDQLYTQIEQKIAKKPILPLVFSLAGAVAVLLVAFTIYFGIWYSYLFYSRN